MGPRPVQFIWRGTGRVHGAVYDFLLRNAAIQPLLDGTINVSPPMLLLISELARVMRSQAMAAVIFVSFRSPSVSKHRLLAISS